MKCNVNQTITLKRKPHKYTNHKEQQINGLRVFIHQNWSRKQYEDISRTG